MFPILAGNSASTGYNLTRSLRFRNSASAYLSRTNTATVTNNAVWTWSAWVKIGYWSPGNAVVLFGNGNGGTNECTIKFTNNQLEVINYASSTVQARRITTAVFRDPSAWYHIVVASNSSTALNIYVNGVQITSFGTSTGPSAAAWALNTASTVTNLGFATGLVYFNGEMAEVNFIDGQALTPSSFGATNPTTSVWQPVRYAGTYGLNGFYLPFTDNSALTTSSNVGLGKDFSGNGNYWTTNNISITAGVTYDSMTDVPTLTSATASNFAVINPLDAAVGTASNGNLSWTTGATNGNFRGSIAIPSSGKFYFEGTVLTTTSSSVSISLGVAPSTASLTLQGGQANVYQLFAAANGFVFIGATPVGALGTFNAGDVLQVAVDITNTKLWLGKNNVFYDSSGGTTGNPTTGANPVTTNSVVGSFAFGSCYQDTLNVNFGQRPFSYTPPTGFVALNTYNLPTSTIVKGNTVMDATLYTGTGASLSVTNAASFKPDLVWVKSRSAATDHAWYDSVRGTTKQLESNNTGAETTEATGLTAFGSAGFTVGALAQMNTSAATYVGWQWQAGQGTSSSNNNGTITSTVSVNASAGFSVVTYVGNGTIGATVGHGLGVAPSMIIVKNRGTVSAWSIYHASLGATQAIYFDTSAGAASLEWNNTAPTSSVFSLYSYSAVNQNTGNLVAYCWAPIAGFSAFGSFVGNGSSDGTFVYTGFRPRFVMFKQTNGVSNWQIIDTARSPYNVTNTALFPDLSSAETSATGPTGYDRDFLSNGFKMRSSASYINGSGNTFIYMAFAESPFRNALAR